MSDDVAFRIQLGLILPKIQGSIGGDLTKIVDELVSIVKAGTVGDGVIDLGSVKEIMMKDLEIYLDTYVFPEIDKKLNPPVEEPAEAEAAAEEAPAEE